MTWQPIDTAPKGEDTMILGYSPTDWPSLFVAMRSFDAWIYCPGGEDFTRCHPTHWMPLPAPPQDERAKAIMEKRRDALREL